MKIKLGSLTGKSEALMDGFQRMCTKIPEKTLWKESCRGIRANVLTECMRQSLKVTFHDS